MRAVIALVVVLGCSKKRDDAPPPPPPPVQAIDAMAIDSARKPVDPRIAPETPALADGVEMPPACAELRKLMAKIALCEKVPAQTREMLLSSFSQLDKAFEGVGADTRAQLETSCQSAIDGIQSSAKVLCDL